MQAARHGQGAPSIMSMFTVSPVNVASSVGVIAAS
jgi:hypothetical protein